MPSKKKENSENERIGRPPLELLDFDDGRGMWHKEVFTQPVKRDKQTQRSFTRTRESKKMTAKGKTRIFNKFLLFVLSFVILSITITGSVLTWINFKHFRETITTDYQNIIQSSAGEIGIFMSHGIEGLKSLAGIMAVNKLDRWQQEITLSAFQYQHKRYLSVSLLSPNGKILATTRWEDDQASGKQALFASAMAGKSGISNVQFTKEQLPFVLMSVPVTAMGKVTAVLCAVLDLKHIWNVLEGITIGKSGQVYIMDLSGRYLAHRNIDRVVTQPPKEVPGILTKIHRSEVPVSWFEKNNGTTYYCLGTLIPELDWVVVLHQPTREIYYYLFRNILWATLITLTACMSAAIIGWYRIKKFLEPIHSLHHQVQRIGTGDFERNVLVSATDEIGELAMAFNEMTKSLKEKIRNEIETARQLSHVQDLAVLGISAGKVTHEVGNLLNNVSMSAIALGNETLSPQGKKTLAQMDKESTRVRTFIQSFLQFAKPAEIQLKPVALNLIIREAMAMHEPNAEKQGVTLAFKWPENVPQISADAELIYQAVNNMIKNSIEAMPQSGELLIKGEVAESRLKLSIQDSGPGIPPEHIDRIFEPFFTTKGKSGTGLGMAIVKSTITAHRGTITCRNNPKGGTCFEIYLPLQ